MSAPFPVEVFHVGSVAVTDTALTSLALAWLLVMASLVLVRLEGPRRLLMIAYEALETSVTDLVSVDVRPLVPLILTQWIFLAVCNLADLLPLVSAPTRDLSITSALALVAFLAGHVHAARTQGLRYLRHYLEPNPLLLPFNIIGELSRTLALALRLFGNMLSGTLIGGILVALAGLLVPVPLMVLSVLTGVVQSYIFGVLTLVFAAGSLEASSRPPRSEETSR